MGGFPVPQRFVIGTGHCGTAFTAAWLRAARVECSHELVWTIGQGGEWPPLRGQGGPQVEASWMATPYVGGRKAVVVVREPVTWARSLYRSGVMHEGGGGPLGPATRAFIRAHTPEVFDDEDPWGRCWRFWVAWNRLAIGRGRVVVRLEEMRIGVVMEGLGVSGDAEVPAPRGRAARNSRVSRVGVGKVPDPPDAVEHLAKELGYL